MVEINPKLFVTCRLCLDVEGQFQIVPSVQKHIKYCFDIHVEPFDQLPQLICKKCNSILKEYYAIKKNFIEKQKVLKAKPQNNKIQQKNLPLHQLEDSERSTNKVDTSRKREHKIKKAKRTRVFNRILSSSVDNLHEQEPPISTTREHSLSNGGPELWEVNLTKYFVCRICSQRFDRINGVKKHINKHIHLQSKYKNIFNQSCSVVMEKLDGKPNLINCNKSVVYSSDRILRNNNSPYYYTVYKTKKNDINYTLIDNKVKIKKKQSNNEPLHTEILIRKRKRILSSSSNETTIIQQNNRPYKNESQVTVSKQLLSLPTVIDCIDIGSSEKESDKSNNDKKIFLIKGSEQKKKKLKTIHNIVKKCYNKYVTKHYGKIKNKLPLEENCLQHKLLSIGTKIINNKGFNCTGILKFLEYKNLSVIWKETNMLNPSCDGKFVQIATRVRGNDDGNENNLGWKNLSDSGLEVDTSKNKHDILTDVKKVCQVLKKSKVNSINEEENICSLDLQRKSSVFGHSDLEITKTSDSGSMLKELLIQNPASNPKEMPKKTNEDSSQEIKEVFSAANKTPGSDKQMKTYENNKINMPIITSSVSLSPVAENNIEMNNVSTLNSENSMSNNDSKEPEIHYPRIKVKPVSQLMPENPQNIINKINSNFSNHNGTPHVLSSNNSLNGVRIWPSQICVTSEQDCRNLINTISRSSNNVHVARNYITLHTVEFPNTKTSSPFFYLQNLLLVHNISLLDSAAPVPPNSICLIKLKIVCQQEHCQTVTLCLSLYCSNGIFSIKVWDVKSKQVNISQLSANWQWQLLQVYNKEVTTKVLIIASRISDKVYNYTKTFFTILNSITNVQEVCYIDRVS